MVNYLTYGDKNVFLLTLNECYNRPFSDCIVLSTRDGIEMNFTWNRLHTRGLWFSGILEYFYFNA